MKKQNLNIVKNFLKPTKSKLLLVLMLYIILTLFIFLEIFIKLNISIYHLGRITSACMDECPFKFHGREFDRVEFKECVVNNSYNEGKLVKELKELKKNFARFSVLFYTILTPFGEEYEKPSFVLSFCVYKHAWFFGRYSPVLVKESDLIELYEPCVHVFIYYIFLFPYYYLLSCFVFLVGNTARKNQKIKNFFSRLTIKLAKR